MGCPGHLFPSGGKCVLGTPECGGGSSPPASCVTTAVPDAAKVASMPKLDLGEFVGSYCATRYNVSRVCRDPIRLSDTV